MQVCGMMTVSYDTYAFLVTSACDVTHAASHYNIDSRDLEKNDTSNIECGARYTVSSMMYKYAYSHFQYTIDTTRINEQWVW
jgi:hypothetical protein